MYTQHAIAQNNRDKNFVSHYPNSTIGTLCDRVTSQYQQVSSKVELRP
ncbi:MAG: hypothetical protein HC785_21700 [Calothrix sp. CSU_2_0]|nr:hypothetical protein [Calothrix sp. CSU_2_0]